MKTATLRASTTPLNQRNSSEILIANRATLAAIEAETARGATQEAVQLARQNALNAQALSDKIRTEYEEAQSGERRRAHARVTPT